jgi:hypothetical protein
VSSYVKGGDIVKKAKSRREVALWRWWRLERDMEELQKASKIQRGGLSDFQKQAIEEKTREIEILKKRLGGN